MIHIISLRLIYQLIVTLFFKQSISYNSSLLNIPYFHALILVFHLYYLQQTTNIFNEKNEANDMIDKKVSEPGWELNTGPTVLEARRS